MQVFTRFVCVCLLVSLFSVASLNEAHAFLYGIEILEKSKIKSLSDKALLDAYIDVEIELKASKTFHDAAGFNNPREYQKYKDLLRYRYDLLDEIRKRKLDVPSIDP